MHRGQHHPTACDSPPGIRVQQRFTVESVATFVSAGEQKSRRTGPKAENSNFPLAGSGA